MISLRVRIRAAQVLYHLISAIFVDLLFATYRVRHGEGRSRFAAESFDMLRS